MTISRSDRLPRGSPAAGIAHVVRRFPGGRRGIVALGAIGLALGAALNWSWLVAVGMAPVILGVLPCLGMCVFGLCMTKVVGRSCAGEPSSRATAEATSKTTPLLQLDAPSNGLPP